MRMCQPSSRTLVTHARVASVTARRPLVPARFPRPGGGCRRGSGVVSSSAPAKADWRETARPIKSGSQYPAKEFCSNCGLCDTHYIVHVKEACAFLGDGMSKIEALERQVHGRPRDEDNDDELHYGVLQETVYARNTPPVEGAQWTGVVTQIALEMLRSGAVEAVVCVQSDPNDRFMPKPFVATCEADILAARGVKPVLSPSLEVLATVEAMQVKKLLFIGVGCQVQALRSIEKHLGLEKLYVLGTNCTDNGRREGLESFLQAASNDPATVKHYEFMQDYRVHIKHDDGSFEYIPYFCLPANDLTEVIAPSCYSCFDYTNALSDMTVGYMGVPYQGVNMTAHSQYLNVRNERGREMLDSVSHRLKITPAVSSGDRKSVVMQTVISDDVAKMGALRDPAPRWLGNAIAWVLNLIGPKGLEFGKYSIDYHYIRNYLYVNRNMGTTRADQHVPSFAKKIMAQYDTKGEISARLALPKPPGPKGPFLKK
ncbi:hypothetical protein FOA52_000731 [Chlamydomonas sp. UWO 241]|nr:hypothetical protein FOA52_000731 [Chlamydomonas sp. UWO 241]